MLWDALRGRKLNGLKFRRQQPVLGFVIDFYCESLNLAIELDGSVHDRPENAARDLARESALTASGLRFLRFKNNDVEQGLDAVLSKIAAIPLPQTPSPSPTRRGGGAPH